MSKTSSSTPSTSSSKNASSTHEPSKLPSSSDSSSATQSATVRSTSLATRTRQLDEPWRRNEGWASDPAEEDIENGKDDKLVGDPKVGSASESEPRGGGEGGGNASSRVVKSKPMLYSQSIVGVKNKGKSPLKLSTPRSTQHSPLPTPSSSTSSSRAPTPDSQNDDKVSESAFERDDLLAPVHHLRRRRRIAQTSTTSSAASSSGPSQPASTHSDDEDSQQPAKLQGLGLDVSNNDGCLEGELEQGGGGQPVKEPGTFTDGYFDDGEDTDESWLNYSSSRRRTGSGEGGDHSSTSHQHSSSNTSNSPPSHVSTLASSNAFGSPLSPHVPPFSPGLIEIGQLGSNITNNQVPSHPWTTPSAVIMSSTRIAGAREREASWASIASESRGAFPSPSLRATFGNTIASASDQSHASSAGSYSPFASPPPSLYRNDFSSNSSPAFPHSSTMPFTPPSSHAESFEYPQLSILPPKDANRYNRTPCTIHPQISTNTLDGSVASFDNFTTPTLAEDISTLFVYGFPEDMAEREFQNLFLFARGFEAATLRTPQAGAGGFGSESYDAISGGEGSAGGGKGHRDSIDDCDPRNASGGGAGSAGSTSPTKKQQKIGFVKFATRQDALDAMEVLNRRKIDNEKGLALRADVAKKDLHSRKSNAGLGTTSLTAVPASSSSTADQPVSIASSVSSLSNGSALPPPPTTRSNSASAVTSTSNEETTMAALKEATGPSIPLSVLDPGTLTKLANSSGVNPAVLAEIARQRNTSSVSTSSSSTSTGMSAYEAFHSVPSVNAPSSLDRQGYFDDSTNGQKASSPYISRNTSSHTLTRHSSLIGNGSTYSLDEGSMYRTRSSSLAVAQPSPFLPSDSSFSTTSSTTPRVPFPTAKTQGLSYGSYGSGLVPAVVRPQTLAQQQASSKIVAQQQAQIAAAQAYARTVNPADMNAPKNTLYVGGLPAILPSLTGPYSASHLEDSLRNAFSRCPGFRRLQFRSKSNGPIVFVEFEDTSYATRAMNEMYGYTLGGLVKGGIRLSYSKNPLGVRSNGLPSGNPPLLSQIESPSHGVAYPAYPVSYASASATLVDSHRRNPDPYYGVSTYSPSNLASTASPSASASFTNSVDQHQHRSSSTSTSTVGTPLQPATSQGTSSTTPHGTFGSTFSPFGTEY